MRTDIIMGENSIEARLLSRMRRRADADRIVRGAEEAAGPLSLSFAQQRLWFLDRLSPGSADYLVPTALRVRGPLNVAALETALSGLVARHEVLRTAFSADDDGTPQQVITAPWPVEVTVHDLRGDAHAEERGREVLRTEATRPFDLTSGRPLRADLVRLAEDDTFLSLTVHHIVSDGWSSGILARELRELYAAALTERAASLPELPIRYADFAAWQRDQLAGPALERQLGYWRERLAHSAPLELPTDHQRPAHTSGTGDVVTFAVPSEVTERLREAAGRQGASLFMALLSLFQIVLARYSRQDDIAVGTPIAGRNRAEIEDVVGFFVNTLVMRTDLSGDPTFTELVERVKDTALGAYDHQDLPFERLVEEVAPERDLSRNPLFQTMFVLQAPGSADGEAWQLAGTDVEPVEIERGVAKFDLTLTAVESSNGLRAVLEYRTDLFERATIERMAGHLTTLATSVAATPDARLSELNMLTERERQEILVDWNGVTGPYPDTATIHSLIEDRVTTDPDAIAITHGDQQWTYTQINARANQLAHHLRETGITPDTLFAVCLDRSPELIATLLGIMKAGAAFVPLDPEYPTDRITYMVDDAQAPLIITSSNHSNRLPADTPRLLVDTEWPQGPTTNPAPLASPDDLAYIIYTSGSTGRPKGVALEHRGVVNYLHWCDQNYPVTEAGGIGTILYSSVTFDLTITALFLPLIQGTQLAIPQPHPGQSAFDAAIDLILTDVPISFLKATPSHLEILAAHLTTRQATHHITTIVAGGENLTPALVAQLIDTSTTTTTISNEYGATEGSVANVMSLTTTPDPNGNTTTLGRPITNTTTYVLDHHNQPAPIGIPGHALLGGICLARNYHNRPDLTEQRFTPNPLHTPNDPRTYHTGDLVTWRPDGTLEFIGRIDNQIKLRGYRIELGEIENALTTHPHIHTTTITLREDTPGNKQLTAYVTITPGTTAPTTHELRSHLQEQLPDYMIPATYVTLDQLPLTPNGKIDTKALPAPGPERPDLATSYTAPRTDTERTLASVWGDILGIDTVGIHDNFFELGGDSIISIQMIARAKKFGLHLTPRMIFKHQTIAEIAVHAGATTLVDAEQGRVVGDVPLTPIQHWFFEKELPAFDHFNQAELLATDALDPDVLRLALTDLIEHHDALRLRCEDGDDGWRQYLDESVDTDVLDVHDLSDVAADALSAVSFGIAEETQNGLDLAKGPLIRCALLELGATRGQRLLIAVHHLAVDGVSWRILLEDLGSCYEQRAAGRTPRLPAKTTSFRAWAERLREFAESDAARAQFAYWAEAKPGGQVPRDRDGHNDLGSASTVAATLTPDETRALLRDVPRNFSTQINDALLTALAQALRDWTGDDETLIGLEGHGREDLFSDVDLSRTVGWFTSVFPVALRLAPGAGPVESLDSVKEQLGRIPNKGVGYGILRHLGAPDVASVLGRQPVPEVNFNYLGQFSRDLPGIGRYAPADEPKGHSISPDGMRWNVLDVTAAVEGDTFGVYVGYSTALHDRETVERLADGVIGHLRALIAGSAEGAADSRRTTPGVPLTDIGDTDMAAILKRFSI
ncbi:amino acid adenylation domain-containing protein [Streptomyces sp. NPDC055109]